MKTMKGLVLKPLAAAALLCTGTVYAAPPPTSALNGTLAGLRGSTNGLNSVMPSNMNSSILDLRLTLGSTTNSLAGAGAGSLPGLALGAGNNNGDHPLNLFSQNSPLHDNPVGHAAFDTVNDVRRATNPPGLIPVNADRPDLPGLRKDATSDLVHKLKLYEGSEAVLDALPIGGGSRVNLPLRAAAPAIKQPIQEVEEAADEANDEGDDNGFLGVNNSSTLGTDDGADNDGGFLGAGDSSTLGSDNDRDPGDSGFLGAADSSTLGTDRD